MELQLGNQNAAPLNPSAVGESLTARSLEIHESLATIRDRRERLQQTAAMLLDRLEPALREEPITSSNESGFGASAPLARELYGEAMELERLDSALSQALERLEL